MMRTITELTARTTARSDSTDSAAAIVTTSEPTKEKMMVATAKNAAE